jgi:hypothetical protein
MPTRQSLPIASPLPYLCLTILALALSACATGPEVIAQVGDQAITAQELAYRQEVMALRSGEEAEPHVALFQLLEEGLMAEVGRAYDVVVNEEMLADEAARVQASSRDPETLARIRALFGDDEAAYRRLVLQPILVNQLLHARFSLGHDIQAEPLARAQELLANAQAEPASLSGLAQEFGGEVRRLQVVGGRLRQEGEAESPEKASDGLQGLAPYEPEWPDYDRQFVEQVVAGLGPGEIHPQVIEDRRSFLVVRLLSREGEGASLEAVIIPKLAFEPWFQTQSQRVSLTIHDEALREAIVAELDIPYITERLTEAGP